MTPTTRSAAVVVPALMLALAGPALAGGADKPGRYSMSPTDGGFVRLDTETGEMAFCKRASDGGWACEAMPDSQMAMRRDLDRLQRENDSLKQGQRAERRDPPADLPPESDLSPPGGEGKVPIPTEEDVDKLFDYVEGMVRKLKERLKRLEDENKDKGTPL